MNKLRFTTLVATRNDEMDGWIKKCQASLMCPGWVKKLRIADPDIGECTLDYVYCLRRLMEEAAIVIAQAAPRDLPQKIVDVGVATFSAGGVVTAKDEKYPVLLGSIVPQENSAQIATNAMIADAIAFQQTTAEKNAAPGTSTVTIGPKIEATLAIAQQSFRCDLPPNFSNKPLDNSEGLYNMLMEDTNTHLQTRLLTQIAANMDDAVFRRATKVPKDLMNCVSNHNGDQGFWAPSMTKQPPGVYMSDKFYSYLAIHRKVRGTDNKGVSALTAGYYLFAMSRSLDKVLWQVVDILEVMTVLQATSLVIEKTALSCSVLLALRMNGLEPKVVTVVVRKLSDIYTQVASVDPEVDVQYIPAFFTAAAPTVKKGQEILGQTREEFIALFKEFKKIKHVVITHVYLRQYMEGYEHYMMPSIHCHAGHVIMCNKPLYLDEEEESEPLQQQQTELDSVESDCQTTTVNNGERKEACSVMPDLVEALPEIVSKSAVIPYTIQQHFSRMCMANKYKTAFPVRRVPYHTQDPARPLVIQTGIKLGPVINTKGKAVDAMGMDGITLEHMALHTEYAPLEFASKVIKSIPATLTDNIHRSSDNVVQAITQSIREQVRVEEEELPDKLCDDENRAVKKYMEERDVDDPDISGGSDIEDFDM